MKKIRERIKQISLKVRYLQESIHITRYRPETEKLLESRYVFYSLCLS
jgi:hypothetical protein